MSHVGHVHLDALLGPHTAPHPSAQAVRPGGWGVTAGTPLGPEPWPYHLLGRPGQVTTLLWTSISPLQTGEVVVPPHGRVVGTKCVGSCKILGMVPVRGPRPAGRPHTGLFPGPL